MILAMDVGNTNIKCGLFDGEKKAHAWRVATNRNSTSDEYGVQFFDLFRYVGVSMSDVEGIIISSVVPTLNFTLEHMAQTFFHQKPLMVGPGIKTGLRLRYENHKELGSDRICNAVAAYHLYGGPCVTVDYGTATTFGAVSKEGEFLGGCICPGLKVSADALTDKAARLFRVELDPPASVIARTTATNMQSGIIFGYVGQVEYLVRRILREMNAPDAPVIATGGLARLIAEETTAITHIDPELTLTGLRLLYERNAG